MSLKGVEIEVKSVFPEARKSSVMREMCDTNSMQTFKLATCFNCLGRWPVSSLSDQDAKLLKTGNIRVFPFSRNPCCTSD